MTFLPDGRLVVRASVQIKKGELVTRSLVEVIFIIVMVIIVTTKMMIWITVMVMAMIMNKVVNLVARFQERNSQKLRQVMQCTQLRRIELDRSFLIDCQCSRFFISIISIICIISIISIISTISTISTIIITIIIIIIIRVAPRSHNIQPSVIIINITIHNHNWP